MKIRASKHTAFEVDFFAESHIGRGWFNFCLPTVKLARFPCGAVLRFYAFLWVAGVAVNKVREEAEENEKA